MGLISNLLHVCRPPSPDAHRKPIAQTPGSISSTSSRWSSR